MNQKTPMYISDYGKLPPQAVELEEDVLGAIMLEKEAYLKINLRPEDFYKESHLKIFEAIKQLADKHIPIDMHLVVEQLRKNGTLEEVGGAYYITQLTVKISSSANIEFHAAIIRQKSLARKMISMSSSIQDMSFNENTDIADVFEFAEKEFTRITTDSNDVMASDMKESLEEVIKYISELQNKAQKGDKLAIPTCLNALNKELYGGWHAPDLIVIGARPSMGKTQFAVQFAKFASKALQDTLFVSIEMTKIQLLLRMITESDILSMDKIKTGQLTSDEWNELDLIMADLENMNLYISDDPSIRYLSNIKSVARSLARQGKLKLLIIDYLQLIKTNMKFGTRDLEIGYITGELKSLAKELNIPIILLAQLSRPMKGMKVKNPQLEDLRESGNIEQDADIVIFIHRPTYYDQEAVDKIGNSWKNRGSLIIAKHREGERDKLIPFGHDEKFKRIFDDGCDPVHKNGDHITEGIFPTDGWNDGNAF